jgi:23S rRNA (pseudouridine1915-N3)-methyltransferase
MIRLRFIAVGRQREDYVAQGIEKYLKRLRDYGPVEYEEVRPSKYDSETIEKARKKETKSILKKLNPDETNVYLDERGVQKSSEELAGWMKERLQIESSRITFVTGGAYGLDLSMLPPPSCCLSLSSMTFHHRMVVIILLEQVYRAFKIIRGEPYHQCC